MASVPECKSLMIKPGGRLRTTMTRLHRKENRHESEQNNFIENEDRHRQDAAADEM